MSEAWKTIKNFRKETSNMNLITVEEWEQYYKSLLTENRVQFETQDLEMEDVVSARVEEITVDEIRKTLKEMKNGKSAGPQSILIELLKHAPGVLHVILTEIFNKCMMDGDNLPADWNLAYTVLV